MNDKNKKAISKNKYFYMTHSPDETKSLGKKLGTLLQNGDIVALNGDLGAGKTCLIQGIAAGLNIIDCVSSPSFSLIKEYIGDISIYHFDLYRLIQPEELEDLGYEDYFYGNGITLIEWAEKIKDYLPENVLFIKIQLGAYQLCRKIVFEPLGNRYKKMMEELKIFENIGD